MKGLSAVDYHNKLCTFKLPSGGILTIDTENNPDWILVPEESKFNGIINVPYMINHYPSSY